MPDMVKIAAIAVAAALCAVVVKKNVAELGMVLALCAGAIILSCSLGALEGVKELMDTLADTAGLSPAVLAPVVKTVGIAVLTRVSAELCPGRERGGDCRVRRDGGRGGGAACVSSSIEDGVEYGDRAPIAASGRREEGRRMTGIHRKIKKILMLILFTCLFVLPAAASSSEDVLDEQSKVLGLDKLAEAAGEYSPGDTVTGVDLDAGLQDLLDTGSDQLAGVLRKAVRSGVLLLTVVLLCSLAQGTCEAIGDPGDFR